MSRPIARKLLDGATSPGTTSVVLVDAESFTAVTLQFVYTGKRVEVAIKGRMSDGPESLIGRIDSLTWPSGRIGDFRAWPRGGGIEEVWAEVTKLDSGEISLLFSGRDLG